MAYVLASKFGFQLPRWLQIEFSRVVQKQAEDTGQEISPDAIWGLFKEPYLDNSHPGRLDSFSMQRANEAGRESFTAGINCFDDYLKVEGEGDGVLDAFVEALRKQTEVDFEIMEYGEHALGQGADAEAVTYIQLKDGNKRYTGVAISRDIVSSSLNALLRAASALLSKNRERKVA